jgi:hypothetical protein
MFHLRRLATYCGWATLLMVTTCGAADAPRAERGSRSAPLPQLDRLPVASLDVDVRADEGPLELWRHGVGHGGVNSDPLPGRVVAGAAKLRPRLVRIFIQEFFRVYPEHGKLDWSRLDPYLDSFARTGAKVVAAITIKPKPLFPRIDATIWRPTDVSEWQRVIAAMVQRYSVDRPIVTHWEIGNETDIGENGGCPYLIPNPDDYLESIICGTSPPAGTSSGRSFAIPTSCIITGTRCRIASACSA